MTTFNLGSQVREADWHSPAVTIAGDGTPLVASREAIEAVEVACADLTEPVYPDVRERSS
jgi:hypothetical protein